MRKFLFLPLILMAATLFGQQVNPTAVPTPPTFIVAIQMGTDTIKNGMDTVKLSDDALSEMNASLADSNYTVMLTPRGDCGQLNLFKINHYNFIVKEQGNTPMKAVFDYILYAKQPRPWTPTQPHRPPGQ